MSELLSGNQAIARGAWEAGVALGVGYPGTPSTETLESLAKLGVEHGMGRGDGVGGPHCEWAPNEKVALEVALGASMGGVRCLVTMKHVGVNVAADPLMSGCNAGVGGGLVLLAADDPSCYSSQNEQDSRNYAAFARVPMLEPSDSEEARLMCARAFDISEQFDVPVMLRETVRIAHTKTAVDTSAGREEREPLPYEPDPSKWVMMPAMARGRRRAADEREGRLVEFAETCDLNRVEMRDPSVGVICSGAVYQHVREALPDASILKLGLSWPLAPGLVRRFASQVESLYVVEEACDYFELRVRAMGVELAVPPQGPLPRDGEMTPERIRAAFGVERPDRAGLDQDLPPRPPAMCPGCPHRLVYSELRRLHAYVTGDIGCYTLGAVAPLNAVHSCIDMGASLSMAHGMELADVPARSGRPVVGVIGDSTFAHSGIESLLGTIYNGGTGTLAILDNRTTAMTGCQGNPVNGVTLTQQAHGVNPPDNPGGIQMDIAAVCRAMGVEDVREVDSQDLRAVRSALREATRATDRLSVIVFRSPCRLVDRGRRPMPAISDCRACGTCVKLGCPCIGTDEQGRSTIYPQSCIGCGQCAQVCPFGCISMPGAADGEHREA